VCPICSSEVFAYLTRWVQPSAERLRERRPETPAVRHEPRTKEHHEAYRQLLSEAPQRPKAGLVTKGAIRISALGQAGWAWRAAGRSRANGEDRSGTDE
jgi:hypothetical protein